GKGRRPPPPPPPHDIAPHVRRGRRGQRDGRTPQGVTHRAETQVARAEIVAPLTYAVCFVDCEQRDVETPELVAERGAVEALGCDVQQLDRVRPRSLEGRPRLVGGQRRIDERGPDTRIRQPVHLILHE